MGATFTVPETVVPQPPFYSYTADVAHFDKPTSSIQYIINSGLPVPVYSALNLVGSSSSAGGLPAYAIEDIVKPTSSFRYTVASWPGAEFSSASASNIVDSWSNLAPPVSQVLRINKPISPLIYTFNPFPQTASKPTTSITYNVTPPSGPSTFPSQPINFNPPNIEIPAPPLTYVLDKPTTTSLIYILTAQPNTLPPNPSIPPIPNPPSTTSFLVNTPPFALSRPTASTSLTLTLSAPTQPDNLYSALGKPTSTITYMVEPDMSSEAAAFDRISGEPGGQDATADAPMFLRSRFLVAIGAMLLLLL